MEVGSFSNHVLVKRQRIERVDRTTSKILAVLTATLGIGIAGVQQKGLWCLSGAVISAVSSLCGTTIALSS